MFRKLRYRLSTTRQARRMAKDVASYQRGQGMVTEQEAIQLYRIGVDKGFQLGYAQGRNDGITIAKRAAERQLKELIRS